MDKHVYVFDPPFSTEDDLLEYDNHCVVVCWDVRNFDYFHPNFTGEVIDVKLLCRTKLDFTSYVKHNIPKNVRGKNFDSSFKKIQSHLRAAKQTGVNYSLLKTEPEWNIFAKARKSMLQHLVLFTKHDGYKELLDTARALHRIEKSCIKVDIRAMTKLLGNENSSIASYARKVENQIDSRGFIKTKYNPCPGITGRFGIESGNFNTMAILNGEPRKMFVSRFPGGKIYVWDYNAMDFRSIIHMTEDKSLIERYPTNKDFHLLTAGFLFGESDAFQNRDFTKSLCYTVVYGGSDKTLAQKINVTVPYAKHLKELFWKELPQIQILKNNLEFLSRQNGAVKLPIGIEIEIREPRTSLALAGQSFSSYIFRQAVRNMVIATKNMKSKVIFTVHDEIVMDVAPQEEEIVQGFIELIKEPILGYAYEAKFKKGVNYGEIT